MPFVSHRTLVLLAAAVWYTGGVVLLVKGGSLLAEAAALGPGRVLHLFVVPAALVVGGAKAWFVFRKSCRRNLRRIAALERPRPWQFFSPAFFVALAAMIAGGAAVSRMAEGAYLPLAGVALLDLSIAVALLGSSVFFWRMQEVRRTKVEVRTGTGKFEG